MWALVVRALAGALAYTINASGAVLLLEDAIFYERVGYDVARDWLAGRSTEWLADLGGGRSAWLMIEMIAAVYYLMGGLRAVPLLLLANNFLTAAVPVLIYLIGRETGLDDRLARRAAWIVVFGPGFAFWSGTLYKEGLVYLLLALGVYHTMRLQSRWSGRSLLIVMASLVGLLGVRSYLALVMGVAVLIGLLAGRWRTSQLVLLQTVVAVVLVGLIGVYVLGEPAEHSLVVTSDDVLPQLDTSRRDLAAAGSGYMHDLDVSTPGAALQAMPVGLFYFLTLPWPWQLGPLRQTLTIPETTLWTLLYPVIAVGMVRAWRRNRSAVALLLAATGGMCVVYALLSGNVGVAYRMRTQVWLLWAPFVAWGLARRRSLRQGRYRGIAAVSEGRPWNAALAWHRTGAFRRGRPAAGDSEAR